MLEAVTAADLRDRLDAGEFPEGSMGPKVESACRFVEGESRRERVALITALDQAQAALEGEDQGRRSPVNNSK